MKKQLTKQPEKLSIGDRIILLQILPVESDYLTYKVINELRMNLSFSEQEIKDYQIKSEKHEGGLTTTWKDGLIKEITIGEASKSVLKEAFVNIEKAKKLNAQNVHLYEMFVIN